jgi:hypothetical protein
MGKTLKTVVGKYFSKSQSEKSKNLFLSFEFCESAKILCESLRNKIKHLVTNNLLPHHQYLH